MIAFLLLLLIPSSLSAEHSSSNRRPNALGEENCGRVAQIVCSYLEGCAVGNSICETKSISLCTETLKQKLRELSNNASCSKPIEAIKSKEGKLQFFCRVTKEVSPEAIFSLNGENIASARPAKSAVDVLHDLEKDLSPGQRILPLDEGDKSRPTTFAVIQKVQFNKSKELRDLLRKPFSFNGKRITLGEPNSLEQLPQETVIKIKDTVRAERVNDSMEYFIMAGDTKSDGHFDSLVIFARGNKGASTLVGTIENFSRPELHLKTVQYDATGKVKPLND
jgi:hypothetical protein